MRTTSPDPVVEIAAHLRLTITRLARRLRQESSGGLTPSQLAALATIARAGSLTPSELAASERIQRPTATRVIAGLAEAGLLARTPDPHDGRSSRVSLTSHGKAVLAEVRSRKTAYLARRLERLSAEEIATLEAAGPLLERLTEDLEG